jgi:hypothetical protein
MNDWGYTCGEMKIGIMPMLPGGPMFGKAGGGGGGGTGKGPPPLKPLHSPGTASKASQDYWSRQSTQDILESLKPGTREALRVNPMVP